MVETRPETLSEAEAAPHLSSSIRTLKSLKGLFRGQGEHGFGAQHSKHSRVTSSLRIAKVAATFAFLLRLVTRTVRRCCGVG
jgi:hypothetical protein